MCILPVDIRHAVSHACIRQCPSPPAAPAAETFYSASPGCPFGVDTTPDSRRPAVPHTARPEDAELLRQYHRIANIVSSRRVMNSERGGGSTARRILSHGPGGFSHNTGLCRDVYKHISRIAHPDKNLMINAYYCAVADIAMEVARRASDIVASSSSSDRDAFSLVPALDSAQFSALVESHRQAKQGRTPLVRSATVPPVAIGVGSSPACTAPRPFSIHRTRTLPSSSSKEPCLLESHMLSATDAFPDTTPADQRHTPVVGESHFSDIDEDEQEDDAASQSSGIDVHDGAHARAADVSVAHAIHDDVLSTRLLMSPPLLSTLTIHSVLPSPVHQSSKWLALRRLRQTPPTTRAHARANTSHTTTAAPHNAQRSSDAGRPAHLTPPPATHDTPTRTGRTARSYPVGNGASIPRTSRTRSSKKPRQTK